MAISPQDARKLRYSVEVIRKPLLDIKEILNKPKESNILKDDFERLEREFDKLDYKTAKLWQSLDNKEELEMENVSHHVKPSEQEGGK